MNILIIGFTTEGSTDVRFLESIIGSIIGRTFEDVASECEGYLAIHDVIHLPAEGNTFSDEVVRAGQEAANRGIMVLCVHTDADDDSDAGVYENKITPAFEAVAMREEPLCKNLVAIVPVQMTESWMLADKELLKQEIGTTKSYQELGLARRPETVADPKETIKTAIRIAFEDSAQTQPSFRYFETV